MLQTNLSPHLAKGSFHKGNMTDVITNANPAVVWSPICYATHRTSELRKLSKLRGLELLSFQDQNICFSQILETTFLIKIRNSFFQIKPTRFTLILCVFISTSLRVSGNYVPIIRRTYCFYATLVFFTVYGWLSGLLVGMRPVSSHPATSHPYTVKNTSVAQIQ